MSGVVIRYPTAPETFRAKLKELEVSLPLRLSQDDIGVILDDDGRDVIVVDVNSERSDEHAQQIATAIATAVNAFGGFKSIQHLTERANG